MRSKRWRTFGSLAVATAVTGCGRLADSGYAPGPIAVIQGTLDSPSAQPLSLAMLWYPAYFTEGLIRGVADPIGNPHLSQTCLAAEPLQDAICDGTPARGREVCRWTEAVPQPLVRATKLEADLGVLDFALPIRDLPPPGILYDLSGQGGRGTFALGYVIAFHDEDGDGAFRYGTPENPPEPTLASSVSVEGDYQPLAGEPRISYLVAFLDGVIDPLGVGDSYREVVRGLPQGFTFWRNATWTDQYGRPLDIQRQALPMSTIIQLVTLPGPDRSSGCTEGVSELRRLDALPAGAVPTWCSAARDAAVWIPPERSVGPCTMLREEYRADFSCASGPPPAWDCPVSGGLPIVATTSSGSSSGKVRAP